MNTNSISLRLEARFRRVHKIVDHPAEKLFLWHCNLEDCQMSKFEVFTYEVRGRETYDLLPNLLSTPISGTSPDKKFDDKFLQRL